MAAVEEAGRKADRQEGQQKEKCMEKRMLASGFRVFFMDLLCFLRPKSIERGSRAHPGPGWHAGTKKHIKSVWIWNGFGVILGPRSHQGAQLFFRVFLKPPLGDLLFIWTANGVQK